MRRMVLVGGVVATLLASFMAASPASATGYLDLVVSPPTDRIVIDVVTVNGSGCPANSWALAVSPDNTAFTVTYSKFLAQVGGDAQVPDFRRNCQLNLVVHVPQGFTYAIAQADYRGFASIARGASALERASYYFQGQSQTASVSHTLRGPLVDDWQTTDTTDLAALVYAPCGAERNFNINTELRIDKGTSNPAVNPSFINLDSIDGAIDTIYQFHWARCPR
jgi:hypothetical protein